MKALCPASVLFIIMHFALLLCGAIAKLPEPDAVFWGTVKHQTSVDLNPAQTAEIAVVAKLVVGGVPQNVVAQTIIAPGQNNYLLKVPLDDGQEPRLTGTARAGEKIKIYIRNIRKEPVTEFETNETETAAITIAAARGTVSNKDLVVDEDLEPGVALMLRFAAWRSDFAGVPSTTPATADSDGDGTSDLHEYLADTNPTEGKSKFQAYEIRHAATLNSIRFGPVRLSRVYTVFCSPSLSMPDWQPIGTVRVSAASEDKWFDHVIPAGGGAKLFYRVAVDVE